MMFNLVVSNSKDGRRKDVVLSVDSYSEAWKQALQMMYKNPTLKRIEIVEEKGN